MASGDSSSSRDDFPTEKQETLGPSTKRPCSDAAEVKAVSARRYMDKLFVPILLKGLSECNKQRPTDPIHTKFIQAI